MLIKSLNNENDDLDYYEIFCNYSIWRFHSVGGMSLLIAQGNTGIVNIGKYKI